MQHDQHGPNQQCQQDVERRVSQKQEHDRQHRQNQQHDAVVNGAVQNHERLVAQEVEEKPDRHHHHEDNQRYRVPEEAEEEDDEDDDGVVHAEVGGVGSDPRDDIAETGRKAERAEVEHELPWPTSGEAGLDAVLSARDVVEVRRWSG